MDTIDHVSSVKHLDKSIVSILAAIRSLDFAVVSATDPATRDEIREIQNALFHQIEALKRTSSFEIADSFLPRFE